MTMASTSNNLQGNRTYRTIHEAYLGTLREVTYDGDCISPRGQKCFEMRDYQFTILQPYMEAIKTGNDARDKTIFEYTRKEMDLYNSMTNRVEDFAKASKFWNTIANPDGTINSAYGYLIWKNKSLPHHTPWEWAVKSLIKDKDTRQAFVRFSLPSHQWIGNKDQVCTMHANFLIRQDKLHLTVVMRSNDVWLGLTYDLPWFVGLINLMIVELKDTYPELQPGSYTHFAHSIHVYERDLEKIQEVLRGQAR